MTLPHSDWVLCGPPNELRRGEGGADFCGRVWQWRDPVVVSGVMREPIGDLQ